MAPVRLGMGGIVVFSGVNKHKYILLGPAAAESGHAAVLE